MAERKWRIFGSATLFVAIFGVLAAAPALADEAEPIYDPSSVSVIDLELPQSSIAALEADPTGDYQPGTFSIAMTDGSPAGIGELSPPLTVGIRLKGKAGSFRPLGQKAAFKIKFSQVKGQKLLGLKKMTLNNMVQDPSMVHETLAYAAFRALGVPGSRTGYSFVRLNDEILGVYLNVEDLDEVGLEKRFGSFDDPQHLYEGEYGTDVTVGGEEGFEVDEGDEEDRSDLEALSAAVDDELALDWSERVELFADLAAMTRMWAVEKYAGHWDGYAGEADNAERELPNNFYLYSDPAGRFQMLPWGADQTWEERVPFDGGGGVLFDRCLDDASCATLFTDAATAALDSIPVLGLDTLARCTAQLLAPWQALERRPIRPHDADAIAAAVAATRDFLAARPGELAAWLGTGTPAVPAEEDPCPPAPESPSSLPRADPVITVGLPDADAPSLRLERVGLARGALVTRIQVPAPGQVDLRGTIRTRKGVVSVCAVTASAASAGPLSVRCPLSRAALQRLGARWLKVRLDASIATAAPAPAATASGVFRLARAGRGD